jgi:DNA polymerase V
MGRKTSGFASPAQGYEDSTIDLNGLLVRNPPATYFYRLENSDMDALGLRNGALLVVDRSRKAAPDDFVLLVHEGRFLCRLFTLKNGGKIFTDGKSDIVPIANDTAVIGVVTAAIQVFGYDFSH